MGGSSVVRRITLTVIAAAAVITIAGGVYYIFHRTPGTPDNSDGVVVTQTEEGEPSLDGVYSGTYAELIERGQPISCKWTAPEPVAEYQVGKGDFYTDGVNRGFSTAIGEIDGTVIIANVLFDEGFIYTWNEIPEAPFDGPGSKVSRQAASNLDEDVTEEHIKQGQRWLAMYQFDCQPWTVDATKFRVPTDRTFRDISGS